MQIELRKAEEFLKKGNKEEALCILKGILEQYPDAQDVRERIRVIK